MLVAVANGKHLYNHHYAPGTAPNKSGLPQAASETPTTSNTFKVNHCTISYQLLTKIAFFYFQYSETL